MLFPEPECPTNAVVVPALAVKLKWDTAGWSVTVQNPLGIFQPQLLQNGGKQALHFLPRRFSMMEQIGLFHLAPYSDGWVKGGHGVLHNQADFFPIDGLSLSFRQVEQIFSLEQDFAISAVSVPQQSHNCFADISHHPQCIL